jgi:O-antigen/teichoic acid export membrane protein
MNSANLWQLIIMAILPLIISYALAKHRNPALIIFLMGMSAYLCNIPLFVLIKEWHHWDLGQIWANTVDLFNYGISRTPGGIIFVGILTTGPILAPYFGKISDAGFLVIGQSVFRIIEASVVAFGLVALPKFSQFVAEGNTDLLRNRISDILTMIIHLSLFIVIQLFIWANEIVLIWLGTDYLQAVPIIQIFLITLCPYLSYVMLRSIIDAVEKKAVNTLNLLISFGITILLCLLLGNMGFGAIGLAISAAIGMSSLGIFSSYFLVKRYKIRLKNLKFASILLVNCFIAIIDIIAKKYSVAYFDSIQLFVAMTLIGGLLFVSYTWFLYKRKTDWVIQLKIRIFPQTSS